VVMRCGRLVRGLGVCIVVMVVSVARAAARVTLPRAGPRDQACNDAAEQGEKDDRLIHEVKLNPSSD
ncbi:MAG: hypothetical protein WCE79_28490, partial [Xanthobacteraceae bacterium]